MPALAGATITLGTMSILRAAHRQIRVLTIDLHQLVPQGLAGLINREEDMAVVASAATATEALDAVRRHRPHVVTLDLLLPDATGKESARRILTEFPRTQVVATTSAQGHVQAGRALDAGIHGYFSKASSGCEKVRAMRQVQARRRMIPMPKKFCRYATCERHNSWRKETAASKPRHSFPSAMKPSECT